MLSPDHLGSRFKRLLRRKPSDDSIIKPPLTLTPAQTKGLLYKTCPKETTSANACEGLESLSYTTLPTTTPHIRLLRIQTVSPLLVVCSLDSHALSEVSGKFHALSYTWGTEGFTAEIVCNKQKLCITPSLEEILRQLYCYQVRTKVLARGAQNAELLFWIDAICLNQTDLYEIKAQIPLMGQIYSEAKSTFAYLGKSTTGSDLAFAAIPQITSILKKIIGKKGVAIVALSKTSYPIGHQIWDHFGDLSRRPWCERLWILQEVVLARHVLFGCGDFWVSGHDFLGVYRDLQALDIDSMLLMPTSTHPILDTVLPLRGVLLMKDTVATNGRTEGMRELFNLMHVARSRLCMEPADRLHGILGLLGEQLQTEIKLQILTGENNLPAETKTPTEYCNIYKRLAKFCLHRDSTALSKLLLSAPSVSRPDNLPSWCPNWASRPQYTPYSLGGYKCGGTFHTLDASKQLPPLSIQSNSNELLIKGFRLDTIKHVLPDCDFNNQSENADPRDPSFHMQQANKILAWESHCLTHTRQVIQRPIARGTVPSDFYMALIGGEIRLEATSPLFNTHPGIMYSVWRVCAGVTCTTLNTMEEQILFKRNLDKYLLFFRTLLAFCVGRRFVSTVGGRVGMVGGDVEVGDTVCLIYGAGPLFLLRFDEEGEVREGAKARLVGDAYIHWLMEEGQAFNSPDRGADETFVLV